MNHPAHFVAIFGGAVAGAEAACQLSERGIYTVIFEQNALPYGKIEDGLPKWHVKLRNKEEQKIDEKINLPYVFYVPNVKLGSDIDFEEVVKNWGFSAVLLATGAWEDRPLPIEGIDDYINKGLYYQNPLVYWFNHYHEPDYNGRKQQFEIHDDTVVVGGGLASIDVVKILMIETVQKALEQKGHKTNLFTLDRSIAKVLEELGLTLSDLGIKGCTLYYRRRIIDMPLSPLSTDTAEQLEKAQNVRQKILNNFQEKFLFRVQECQMPIEKIVEGERLAGLVFQKTKVENGKAVPIPDSETKVKAPLVISSIGSIPELIDGIPVEGKVFKIKDFESCQIEGYENVFALGNAVTGKGNINESLKHGRELSQRVMDNYLDWQEEDYQNFLRQTESNIGQKVDTIAENLKNKNLLSVEKIQELKDRIKEFQQKVNYDGDYNKWVEKHLPKRLEDMIEVKG